MNNFDFGHTFVIRLTLCAVLLTGILSPVKADTQYGPLRAGESLSRIVNQNYLASPYSNDVIMREILRLNPQAFINNNMGLIKQGVMLRLPSDASIRRSQQQRGVASGVVAAASTVLQAETRPTTRVQTLQATLTQVRNERDQATLRARRIETESADKLDTLNASVLRLESEKENISQQLTGAESELATLRESLKRQSDDNSEDLTQQLEESKQIIAQKQQTLEKLEASVSELQAASETLTSNHEAEIIRLTQANQTLEEQLAARAKLGSTEDVAKQIDAKVAELTAQHQQQLADLQASFDAKTSEASTTQAGTEKLAEELETVKTASLQLKSDLAALQSESEKLKQQHESEVSTLNSAHKQAVDKLNASLDAQLAETAKSQAALNQQVESAKVESESVTSELAILTNENNQLKAELSEARTALAASETSDTATDIQNAEQEIIREPVNAGPVDDEGTNPLIGGPITKQLIVERLETQVPFPLWGLLLGAFALGFTSLMMLFTRRRESVVAPSASAPAQASSEPVQEELVFRAGDPTLQDPDVESLRVPARRDPSRVAILDPTMAATAAAAGAVGVAAIDGASNQQQTPAPIEDSPTIHQDQFETKLKLLMAQAYEELGDTSAASELLAEVDEAKRTP